MMVSAQFYHNRISFQNFLLLWNHVMNEDNTFDFGRRTKQKDKHNVPSTTYIQAFFPKIQKC